MAIDPFVEEILPFAQAARRLPPMRGGRPVSPATLWRWASAGLRGVRLETVRVGGTTCTSVEALKRFFAALGGAEVPDSTKQSPAGDVAVEARLAEIGI